VPRFNADVGIITVQTSRSGKARHVYLTDEGRRVFQQAVAGHDGSTLIFMRQDGEVWGQSHQFRPLREAYASARIEPAYCGTRMPAASLWPERRCRSLLRSSGTPARA